MTLNEPHNTVRQMAQYAVNYSKAAPEKTPREVWEAVARVFDLPRQRRFRLRRPTSGSGARRDEAST